MNQADQEIREAVDRLLFEQGTYTPLELLLSEGRLMYADYEAWRGGECDYLEELLFGDPGQSFDLMRRAETYAKALALVPETQCYVSGGAAQGRSLRFSSASASDKCFHTGYRKDNDAPQLDLLMDTAGVTLANGIIRALVQRNEVEARRLATERLFDDFDVPEDYQATAELVQTKPSPLVDAGVIDKRKFLQARNPELIATYLRAFMTNTCG